MMKKQLLGGVILALLVTICLWAASPAAAQTDDVVFEATVQVDDGFVRFAPDMEAEVATSVFEDQVLEVVGRNLDGTWFEVRRPGRFTNLGWIFHELVDWDFPPEQLPLTDFTTGLLGPYVLSGDPGFAVYMNSGAVMRAAPERTAERVGVVPRATTVPVLERNQDGSWLRVHYRGYEGWIIGFAGRDLPEVLAIPQAPNLPPLPNVNVFIVPPEVQLSHVNRMRDYVTPRRDLAANLETFWMLVFRGEVLPCDAPPEVTEFTYLLQDVRELPEIARYAPQINSAVGYLSDALEPLETCGVLQLSDIRAARADAINARITFDAALGALDNLEDIIR